MAATALATQIPRFYFHPSLKTGFHTRPRRARISLVQASSANDKPPFVSQDLKYLAKLGAGSVAGAAAIKYGSILFPEITLPNLGLALLIISAPVVLALFILIKQSWVVD